MRGFNSTLSDLINSQYPESSFRQGFATRSVGSCQAILPDILRVNANPFQTDLCRNPASMDGFKLTSMALDTRFPAGMTGELSLIKNHSLE
jgi:hypothetical protein